MVSRIVAVLAVLALLPVLYAEPMRFSYEQWCAHQLAKVRNPSLVVIGDSIGAGGRDYGSFDTVNLAANGSTTQQTAAALHSAQAFNPRHIIAVTGMNDAFLGEPDLNAIGGYWREMLKDPRVIPALVTPTRVAILNRRANAINAVIEAEAARVHRPFLAAGNLAGPDGLIRPDMVEADGVHPKLSAYTEWREEVRHLH